MRNNFTSLARLAGGIALVIALVAGLVYLANNLNLQPVQPGGDLTATPAFQPSPLSTDPTVQPEIPSDMAVIEQQVRSWIYANQPDMNPAARFPLVEITTGPVREQFDARVFKVTGDVWTNEAFLIWNGQVYKLSIAFGDQGIETLLVTDLDANGQRELVYNSHFGSGISSTIIGAFLFEGSGQLLEARLPGSQTGRLTLAQVDEKTVIVRSQAPGSEGREWRLELSGGVLKLVE